MYPEGDETLWSWSVFRVPWQISSTVLGDPDTLQIKLIEYLEIWKQATHSEAISGSCEPGTLKERKRTQRFFGVQTQTEEIAPEGPSIGPLRQSDQRRGLAK